jgi:GAF domain-containing protein
METVNFSLIKCDISKNNPNAFIVGGQNGNRLLLGSSSVYQSQKSDELDSFQNESDKRTPLRSVESSPQLRPTQVRAAQIRTSQVRGDQTLRKLRHPSRSSRLRAFLGDVHTDGETLFGGW